MSRFLVVFLNQDSHTARTSDSHTARTSVGKCAKVVNRRLLMLTCMKARLLRLQKSRNESTWGVGVELGTA